MKALLIITALLLIVLSSCSSAKRMNHYDYAKFKKNGNYTASKY
jgi:hypothetical protein